MAKNKYLITWINSNWPKESQVLLFSKGFFLVIFPSREDLIYIMSKGPWFWGSAGIFITTWFHNFDLLTMVVTKVPIWVRLPNLQIHFWTQSVFEGIGNALGCYLSSDDIRSTHGLFTFSRICATIVISSGIPDMINLKLGNSIWSQALYYVNTAFKCKICWQKGHLLNACPQRKTQQQRTMKAHRAKS